MKVVSDGENFVKNWIFQLSLKVKSEAWNNKGLVLYELGNHEKATEAYEKAIEINPQYSEAWNNKGLVLYKLGNYEKAIEAYDKAIKINSQYSEAWYFRACAHSLFKDQALSDLEYAIELDPSYKEIARNDEAFKELWADEDFKKLTKSSFFENILNRLLG